MKHWMPTALSVSTDALGNVTFKVRSGEPFQVDAADADEFFRLVDLVRDEVLARASKEK